MKHPKTYALWLLLAVFSMLPSGCENGHSPMPPSLASVQSVAKEAQSLPNADRKMPLIAGAALATAKVDVEFRRQEWTMFTASIGGDDWQPVMSKLDRILTENGFSVQKLEEIRASFAQIP
jgi:hypothetical protein